MADLLVPYDQLRAGHEALLSSIVESARRSAVYRGRLERSSGLRDLSEVPLTSYLMIDQAIEKHGLDACLLRAPDHTFKTSGSTGNPKSMFYSNADVDRVAKDFAIFCQIIGMHRGDMGWNLGGRSPMSPGRSWTTPAMWRGLKS